MAKPLRTQNRTTPSTDPMIDRKNTDGLDATAYSILLILADAAAPLWKQAIYERMKEQASQLPITDTTKQTVSRRVDALHEQAHVRSEIITADESPRNLLIGYKPTENGCAVLEQLQEQLIQQYIVQDAATLNDSDTRVLADLLVRRFDLSEQFRTFLESCSPTESQAAAEYLYALHVLEQETDNKLYSKLRNLLGASDELDQYLKQLHPDTPKNGAPDGR